jgi:hypothetical protein
MTTWSQPFTMTLNPNERYPLTAVPAEATHPTIVVLIKNLGPGNLLVGANTLVPGRFVFSSFANLTIIAPPAGVPIVGGTNQQKNNARENYFPISNVLE